MGKTIGILFLVLTPVFFAAGQKSTVKFDRHLFDFGQVQQWNNPPAHFLFTNTGDADLLFLPIRYREDIFVEIPKGKIKAGQTDTIFVYYFTDKPGEFQQSVDVFASTSDKPVNLTVKGNILSLDSKAYISCPGFAPKEHVDELSQALNSLDSLSGNVLQGIVGIPASGKPTTTPAKPDEVMEFEEPEEATQPKPALTASEEKVLPKNMYAANNIIFLIDISGSMKKSDKLPLLKVSMKNLTQALRGIDNISVVVYSTTSTVLLPSTSASRKEEITLLIDTLKTSGMTNGVKGLETAYDIAQQNFIPGGNNQVIIATDGVFNGPSFSESAIYSMVRDKAADDIILSVVGFGDDKEAIKMMKKMAYKGNGSFIQISDQGVADEILINEIKTQSLIGNN